MANVREVKTRLTLDGEKQFKQQIASINRELRLGNAELKEAAATYDLNGNAQQKLAAQSKTLKAQLEAQNRIVAQYEQRMKEAKNATNLSQDGLRNYQIALTNARTKAKQLEKQLNDTDKELEELGRDSRRAGDQLEDNLGDAADDVSDKFSRMVQNIDESLQDIKGMQRISLAVDLVKGAWKLGTQVYSWAQGYAEENMKNAMANYNVAAAGGDVTAANKLAIEYAAIFGDKDSALEAISNLTQARYTGDMLNTMAQYLGGAAIRWQDTLKIESLADSLQESLSEGVLTGQFAELINRLTETTGITQEQVQAQLTEAKKYGTEKEAIEAYLRNAGLETTYQGFVDENKAMVDAAVAAGELNQELAELANELNVLLTPAVKLLAEGIGWINDTIPKWKEGLDNLLGIANDENLSTEEKAIKLLTPTKEEMKQALNTMGLEYETTMEVVNSYSQWAQNVGSSLFGDWSPGKNKKTAVSNNGKGGKVGQRFGDQTGELISLNTSETVATETEKAAETAEAGGKKIGMSLTTGVQGQTQGLLAVARQQRELLEAVWTDPINATIVVGYANGGNTSGGKTNLPTLPENINVTVELDKRQVGQAMVPVMDTMMGGATGAFENRWE